MRRREALAEELRRSGAVSSPAIAAAFEAVPRHRFIPEIELDEAYADRAISIKSEGTNTLASISQPSMLAKMLELADVQPGARVLEIGTGSGYNAALLAHLAGPDGLVVTIEVEPDLAARARTSLAACGYESVRVVLGDGYTGFAEEAPYDRIVVSARASDIALTWWEQLRDGGHIVVPLDIGIAGEYAVGFVRHGGELRSIGIANCLFIALRGALQTASPDNVFVRSADARYGRRFRPIRSIRAVRTADAASELLAGADVVVAQRQTTFAITWE
ncbi:MAG TPA: protein-L-isoaspartate O-methyltransferase [Candidatus Tyrphobacter sp.]